MSLVENVARRPPSNRALLFEFRSLLDRGYKTEQIAEKLGVEKSHAYGIVQLLKQGESVLLQAVDAGRIPLRIAIVISTGTNEEVQSALIEAYEKGDLRGAKLAMARRIVAMRLAKDRVSGRTSLTKRTLSAGGVSAQNMKKVTHQTSALARPRALPPTLAGSSQSL